MCNYILKLFGSRGVLGSRWQWEHETLEPVPAQVGGSTPTSSSIQPLLVGGIDIIITADLIVTDCGQELSIRTGKKNCSRLS